MSFHLSRRIFVGGLVVSFAAAVPNVRGSYAQATNALERLRSEGVMRVGLVNEPPYSGLNPDGTVSGFVPILVSWIMSNLGVPKIEGVAVSYGELIPGLQAGRWDMIAASFRLTKERCPQVLFTDPVTFDGGALAFVESDLPNPPRSLKELADSDLSIGLLQGTYLLGRMTDLGVPDARMSQYPDNPALIDALLAERVDIALSTNASLKLLLNQRPGAYETIYPLPEDPPVGSGPAFSRANADLHTAFNAELAALRDSGELDKLAAEFGFDPPPENLRGVSAEEICASFS